MQFWLLRFLGLLNSFRKTLPVVKKTALLFVYSENCLVFFLMADITKNSASLALSIRTSYACPDKHTSAVPLCWEQWSRVTSEVTRLHCQSAHDSSLRCVTVAVVEPFPLVFKPLIGQRDLTLSVYIASSFWHLLDMTWQPAYVARCAWDYFKIPWTGGCFSL